MVPVAHNAGEFWPKGGFLKKRGTVKIVIGPVISSQGRKADEILAEAECWIETTMAKISNLDYPAYTAKSATEPET